MTEPLVSVVIPAWNAERWISRALESVVGQDYANLEILVVDDGSDDRTPAIAKSYGSRIRYFRQEKSGVSAARNRGIRQSRGELISFLDADDEYLPRATSTLVALLSRFPEAEVGSAAHVFDGPDGRVRRPTYGVTLPGEAIAGIVPNFFEVRRRQALVNTITVVIRRRALEDVGYFRTDLKLGEDLELWSRLAGRFTWAFADTEVAIYHRDPASSGSLQPESVPTVDWLYPEETMRRWIRSELWDSYRRFRRDMAVQACKAMIVRGEIGNAKNALAIIDPAPDTREWRMMRWGFRLPAPFIRSLAMPLWYLRRRKIRPPPGDVSNGIGGAL